MDLEKMAFDYFMKKVVPEADLVTANSEEAYVTPDGSDKFEITKTTASYDFQKWLNPRMI